jgi:predicted nucleotidyltransferase
MISPPAIAADESSRFDSAKGSNRMPSGDGSSPHTEPTLQQAFSALISVLNERRVRYAIIGGVAILQHTRVRATEDIDALLSLPHLTMPGLFEALGDRGFDVDVVTNVREFRDHGLTCIRYGDILVDLLQPILPVYAHVLDHAVDADVLGQTTRIGSAEGLIVMKVIAARPQDQADVRELIAAYGRALDLSHIRTELDTVMNEDDPKRLLFESWLIEILPNPD